jgi:hypothetical protein
VKKLLHIQFLSIAAIAMLPGYVSASESVVIYPQSGVFDTREVYEIQKGRCTISLEVSGMGGHTLLALPSKAHQKEVIGDVTGVAYRSNASLVFTVSPIYGRPGIYIYDCVSERKKQTVKPRSINKAYPDGVDYFELQAVAENKIYFYYAPDVESTDFTRFRSKDFLYEVNIDGSGFRKARE